MVWNEEEPSNATKIRVYPQVLTDNWKAIQAGEDSLQFRATNFLDRSEAPETPPVDPVRIDDTMILFSKNDGTNTEFFIENDQNPSDIMQLTQAGSLGSDTTNIIANSISLDDGSTTITGTTQVSGWAKISSAGSITSGSGDLTVSGSGGLYTVGFVVAPVTTTFVGLVTINNTTSRRSVSVQNYSATDFDVRIYSNSTGNNEAEAFQVVVFGGR